MVKAKKEEKKNKKEGKNEEEYSGGASLDDAFADDSDVEYAKDKPKKEKKKKGKVEEEMEEAEEEVEELSKVENGNNVQGEITIKASKPIVKVKKGDKVWVDGKEYEVDQHYVLIDHGATKEMAIELFDKNDKDYQLRYFNDQVETTMEFYELQEILYVKKVISKVEW